MTISVQDYTACFNINALVTPSLAMSTQQVALSQGSIWPDPTQQFRASLRMQRQFIALLEALDFSRSEAQRLAAEMTDWIDSDSIPSGLGAEDGAYLAQKQRYRTANQLVRSVSEILDVRSVTPDVYARIRPWLCAHPAAAPSPINVNLLTPDQTPLLMMLAPRALTRDAARRVLADVPVTGWQSAADFWGHPALINVQPGTSILAQTVTKSRYFTLNVHVAIDRGEAEQNSLFEVIQTGPRLAARTWQERL
jgi:general secretion pathway protein K